MSGQYDRYMSLHCDSHRFLVLGVGGYQKLSVLAKGASFGIPASQQLLSGLSWVSVKELKFKYYSKETLSCTLYTHIIVT